MAFGLLFYYMIITTPSGYKVTLKEKLSFGETRDLQKFLLAGEKVEMVDGKPLQPKVSMDRAMNYSEKAVDFLVTNIDKGGTIITSDFNKEIYNWDEADGQAVFEQVDKILKPTKTEKAIIEEKKSA